MQLAEFRFFLFAFMVSCPEIMHSQAIGNTKCQMIMRWYALLLTQAKYKNYVSLVENDSPCKRFYIQKCELILEHGTEHPTK